MNTTDFTKFIDYLESEGHDEEIIENLKSLIEPMFEFRTYMKKKINKTDEELEKISEEYFIKESKNLEPITSDISPIQYAIESFSKIYGKYAMENGYKDYEKVESSTKHMMEITITGNINKSIENFNI